MNQRKPQCVVIGGPNGAGKTSAAPMLLRDTVGIDAFVNADVIAQGLAGFRPEAAACEAGRIMLQRLVELTQAREDFAFESTLSGRSTLKTVIDLLDAGYEVHIFYLWLPAPDFAVARVRHRVASGGHDVPESVIRRRFRRSVLNFFDLYRPKATMWRLYDGSKLGERTPIAYGVGVQDPIVVDEAKWKAVRSSMGR